jgi:hypothetical protein
MPRKFAKRLDCGRFSAALETRGNLPLPKVLVRTESAAEAGAIQTLREFANGFAI